MSLRMGFGQRLVLTVECSTCGELCDESDEETGGHVRGCPVYSRACLARSTPTWGCASCRGQVEPDIDDFLQCRTCSTRYTRGMVADGENPDGLQKTHLRYRGENQAEEEYTLVFVLSSKGGGKFRNDAILKRLDREEVEWRKRTRDRKRKQLRIERAEKQRRRSE